MRENGALCLLCLLYLCPSFYCVAEIHQVNITLHVGRRDWIDCLMSWDLPNPEKSYFLWQKNGIAVSVNKEVLQKEQDDHSAKPVYKPLGRFVFKSPTFSDEGIYSCVKVNLVNKTLDTLIRYKVEVTGAPNSVTLSADDVIVDIGSSVTVTCSSHAKPTLHFSIEKYQWLSRPKLVSNSAVFTVNNVSAADEGEYRCSVTSRQDSQSADKVTTYFQVHVKRNYTSSTEERPLREAGKDAWITCTIAGYPELPFSLVTWQRVDGNFSERYSVIKRSSWEIKRRHEILVYLLIKTARADDDGIYRCVVFDPENRTIEESTSLLKIAYMGDIKYISEPQILGESEAADIVLECRAEGYPVPFVTWRKVNPVSAKKNNRIKHMDQKYVLESTQGVGILTLKNVTSKDTGRYECIASNGYQTAKRKETYILMKTHGIPFKVPVTVLEIDSREVKLQWQRNSLSTRSEDESYNVTYTDLNTNIQEHFATYHNSAFQSNKTFTQIIALLPDTPYEIKVVAFNDFGSRASDALKIRTHLGDCYKSSRDTKYKGTVSRSQRGNKCLPWNSVKITNRAITNTMFSKSYVLSHLPDKNITDASNYCRNPIAFRKPWCFVGGSDYYGRYLARMEYCDVPRCKFISSEPQLQWIKCANKRLEFAVKRLPIQETDSYIYVSCECMKKNSYKTLHYYYSSDQTTRVFSMDFNCGDQKRKGDKRDLSCRFLTQQRIFLLRSKTVTVSIPCGFPAVEKLPQLEMIWPHNPFSLDTYKETFVEEGITANIGCKGTNIDYHVMSLMKDGRVIASTVFDRSHWKTGAPFFPRLVKTKDNVISLLLNVTFDLDIAGSVFTCHLDTHPGPITKKKAIAVIRKPSSSP